MPITEYTKKISKNTIWDLFEKMDKKKLKKEKWFDI